MDFAQGCLQHESTGMTPFEIEQGYVPRMSIDWDHRTKQPATPKERLNREEAQGWIRHIEKGWEFARARIEEAQRQQAGQANKKRREPDFDVGDRVFVLKDGWKVDRPSRKLDTQTSEPWTITEKVGHSYRLNLPAHWKMHPIFHADQLRKAPEDPLPGQHQEPEPPMEVNGELEWEVEALLASRVHHRKLQYRARWKGYDEDPDYYDAEGFKGSPHLIKEFHAEYLLRPGPPIRLQEWLEAWEKDTELEEHPDDNKPAWKG